MMWRGLIFKKTHIKKIISIFSLIVFGRTEAPIVNILLCHPSEDSLQGSAIPDGSPSKEAGEIAGFESRTAVSQSGVTTKEPPLLQADYHLHLQELKFNINLKIKFQT
jgi:hypothetical protein